MKATDIASFVLTLLFSVHGLLAVTPSGQVTGWGKNTAGEARGLRSFEPSAGVVEIGGKPLNHAVAVATGMNHGLALLTNGTVVGWGFGHYGQTAVPSGLKNVTAIAAGYNFSVALKSDGTVSAWGDNQDGQTAVPTNLNDVVAISAGMSHALALKRDGTVVRWGHQTEALPDLNNIVAIAAGGSRFERNLALKTDGTVIAWGGKAANPPSGLTNVLAIAVGEYHSLALKSDGTVVGWGHNGSGEATGVPTTNSPYVADGVVTISGQVLTNVIAIAAANEYGMTGTVCKYSLALKNDGTVVAWGRMAGKPATAPPSLSKVVAIAAGHNFCLAIQRGTQ